MSGEMLMRSDDISGLWLMLILFNGNSSPEAILQINLGVQVWYLQLCSVSGWRTSICLWSGGSLLGIHCPDLYFSGVINGALALVSLWDLLLNCVLFSEACYLGGGKLKRVIYICVFFQAWHENSHSGNIIKALPICPFQTVWGVFSSGVSMNSAVMIWCTLTR